MRFALEVSRIKSMSNSKDPLDSISKLVKAVVDNPEQYKGAAMLAKDQLLKALERSKVAAEPVRPAPEAARPAPEPVKEPSFGLGSDNPDQTNVHTEHPSASTQNVAESVKAAASAVVSEPVAAPTASSLETKSKKTKWLYETVHCNNNKEVEDAVAKRNGTKWELAGIHSSGSALLIFKAAK